MDLGIDRLVDNRFKPLAGARLGLLTNFSCCDSNLMPTVHIFSQQTKVNLRVVFAPEHGLHAALQDQVKVVNYYDRKRGIKISSLYSQSLRPNIKLFREIDVLVIDLQDIGTRYYTFSWSAILMIKWMAQFEKKVFILDRPNPLNGVTVQGPVLEPAYSSFVGLFPIPVRHGMTISELCNFINGEFHLGTHVEIIKMKGWRRQYYYDKTGLHWASPSPNMSSFNTALVYPGLCLLEGTNISEGRGSTRPFEIFGAPWIDSLNFVKIINKRRIPGVNFRPTYFIPTFNKYKGRLCGGAQIYVEDRDLFDPFSTGLEIMKTIKMLYPSKFTWRKPPYEFETKRLPIDILMGNSWIRKAIENNRSIAFIKNRWKQDLNKFKRIRHKYLLYT